VKICYYHDTEGNFGDDLNAWMWPKLLPDLFNGTCKHGQEYYAENNEEPALFYGIGTILDERIPKKPRKYIAGVGTGYFAPPVIDDSYNVYFVRGPKTAQKIGLDPSLGIGDPAILLTELLKQPTQPSYRTSLIMHCDTAKTGYWKKIAENLGIHHIDPRTTDPLKVINELIASEYVITESLHGAIIADAFGIPWRPITTMPSINQFKWHDWCESLNIEYHPAPLVSIYEDPSNQLIKSLVNKGKALLGERQLKTLLKEERSFNSNQSIVSSRISHMLEKLEQLSADAKSPESV
jgi:succinoglycan biosynthesis protein ExoV